jgi:hypothetical protein
MNSGAFGLAAGKQVLHAYGMHGSGRSTAGGESSGARTECGGLVTLYCVHRSAQRPVHRSASGNVRKLGCARYPSRAGPGHLAAWRSGAPGTQISNNSGQSTGVADVTSPMTTAATSLSSSSPERAHGHVHVHQAKPSRSSLLS